jgi:hypothetical protein
MTDDLVCPICRTTAKPLDKISDATGFECMNHGRFRVARSVLDTPALVAKPTQEWEAALNRAKARQPGEWAPKIETGDFDDHG